MLIFISYIKIKRIASTSIICSVRNIYNATKSDFDERRFFAMKKRIKFQIIDLMQSILDGIDFSFSQITNVESAHNMLISCYEAVVFAKEQLALELPEESSNEYDRALTNLQEEFEGFNEKLLESKDCRDIYNKIRDELKKLKEKIAGEPVKKEIVFLPYKASMWDSLESVWIAAKEDDRCNAVVMPIPYFDKKPDGEFGKMNYEGNDFPEYVPITDWKSYNLEVIKPDAIYIHNPYDGYNYVTSVHPAYYSDKLKEYTNTLVYIPYYSTMGGMSEGQYSIPAYYNADYIVIQSEKFRKYFDSRLPAEKLLPFGSPKFDRAISVCKNKPIVLNEWNEKIRGKKVYLYNTSIGGFLSNPKIFIEKILYVFECFKERNDAVLIWRPHPLLKSTIKSMAPSLEKIYDEIEKYFIQEDIGILDETPDITNTISLSDAYIGEAGSSVISLFGIAGKPIFILNNYIKNSPEEDDWRSVAIRILISSPEFMITNGNKLYKAEEKEFFNCNKLSYKYVCDTSEYSQDGYYIDAETVNGKTYLCPGNAQNIGVVENGILRKVKLERLSERESNFTGMYIYDRYIVLVPLNYPAIVRYDTASEKIDYFTENLNVFIETVDGVNTCGGSILKRNLLILISPTENFALAFNILTGKTQGVKINSDSKNGCIAVEDDGTDLWLMPFNGTTIIRWNPETGEVKEYSNYPKGFRCVNPLLNAECEKRPFISVACCDDFVLFAPWWANMFIKLDKKTGEMTEWKPPFKIEYTAKNGNYIVAGCSFFQKEHKENEYFLYNLNNRSLYKINVKTEEYEEIVIDFDVGLLRKNSPGFSNQSEFLQYACMENAFNSLNDFLDGNISGKKFNKEEQLKTYRKVTANSDGTCGEKVHEFIMKKLKNN